MKRLARAFLAGLTVSALLWPVAASATAARTANVNSCSTSGLKPRLALLQALGTVACATARPIPAAALAAARAHGFNRQLSGIRGFDCIVFRHAGSHKLGGGHCLRPGKRSDIVDYMYA